MELLLYVVQLLLLGLNVSLQNACPLLQLFLQLVHHTELRLLQLIHGGLRLLLLLWGLLLQKIKVETRQNFILLSCSEYSVPIPFSSL